MTTTQRRTIIKLIKKWVGKLRLQGWDITLSTESPEGEEAAASNTINERYLRSLIQVNTDEPEETWEQNIVHELVHLYLNPLHSVNSAATARLSLSEQEIIGEWWVQELEKTTVRLTRLLYDALKDS